VKGVLKEKVIDRGVDRVLYRILFDYLYNGIGAFACLKLGNTRFGNPVHIPIYFDTGHPGAIE